MKLRLRGDSLRLRVGPGEAKSIAEGGVVQESVAFGPSSAQVLTYSAQGSVDTEEVCATFAENLIRVHIPLRLAREWYEGNDVGIAHTQQIDQKRSLTLLIEKDFACLENPEADASETYPNPLQAGNVCRQDAF